MLFTQAGSHLKLQLKLSVMSELKLFLSPSKDLQHNFAFSIFGKAEKVLTGSQIEDTYKFKENVMLYENRQDVPQDKRD